MNRLLLSATAAMALTVGLGQVTAPAVAQQAQVKPPPDCPDEFAALGNNKQITAQEARAVRLKAFSSLDNDKNNIVSREEYVRCLASTPAFIVVGSVPAADGIDQSGLFNRSEARFAKIDGNGNGKITWKEYMQAAGAEHERFGKSSGQDPRGASAAAGWAFARMDSDLSGDIVKQEWQADAGLNKAAESSFKALDANSDGMVSQAEYLAAIDDTSGSPEKTVGSSNKPSGR